MLLGSWYLQASSNSSSGGVLDVLTEASSATTCRNGSHQAYGEQLMSSVLPDVLYMGKMSFNYAQKFIKNRLGVHPSGMKE